MIAERRPTTRSLAATACLLATIAGCGGPKTCVAKGKVLIDGKPAEGVYVVFHTAEAPAGRPDSGSARTLEDGSFTATVDRPGEAIVTAFWPAVTTKGPDTIEGLDRFEGAYKTGRNPAAKATIREGDNELPTIELKLPSRGKPRGRFCPNPGVRLSPPSPRFAFTESILFGNSSMPATRAIRGLFALSFAFALATSAVADDPPLIRSARSGPWSSNETWDLGRTPRAGDRVVVRKGHEVLYDVVSEQVIRLVQIAGTLDFARDRDTRLDAGLVLVTYGEEPSEDGFDCHAAMPDMDGMAGAARPSLLVGRPGSPIPAEFHATIRLHHVEGMDKASCPAIVCCGGRMEFHGTPMAKTWLKIRQTAEAGAASLYVDEWAEGWKQGDQVIITSTKRQRDGRGVGGDFLAGAQTEERRITGLATRDFTGGYAVRLDRPLAFQHFAEGNFRAEVANLSRNVVIESAAPDGVRGHTMFHKGSTGAVHYAEFRHLGKQGEKGRYSIHFHLTGETMRGSSVIGSSIWDSHNRWITIHGTNGLVIRDNVGYKSVGHGYFLETGNEINNILDHNLAALVLPGKPMKDQEVPFDPNRGAGFWWANSQNSFTRNVAVECAEYGYRFDNKETDDYNPVRSIRQPDGTLKEQDTRIMPFIRFQDNEAHTMKFFCLNLRGVTRPDRGLDFYSQNQDLSREAIAAMPEPSHPFWIRDFRAWEANWSLHLGTTGVFVDGLDSFRSDVAIWRSIMDGSGFRRMTSKDMRVNDIHNPLSLGYVPSEEDSKRGAFRGMSSFRDDMPPVTMITETVRDGNILRVRGSVADTSDVRSVTVNGKPATSIRDGFAEWEITLDAPAGKPVEVTASSIDVGGHAEKTAHVVRVD